MESDELTEFLDAKGIKWMRTGSRYICNPAPTDTDDDYIVLDNAGLSGWLAMEMFDLNTDPDRYQAIPDFMAWRLGDLNVIVALDQCFYDRFCAATELAKARNILAKDDRITLFQSVLYGNTNQETPAPDMEIF
jgi:hypothetical protein